MTITDEKDLQGLLRIGQICGQALQHMLAHMEPGMTTAQLDAIGAAFFSRHKARSAPILAYKFPGHTCISLNDEVAHGIPGDRVIQPGDLINIDVSAELEGYWADTAASAPVPPVNAAYERLCLFARRALEAGIGAAQSSQRINAIGQAVEQVAEAGGYTIIRSLTGHGVGRHIHEKPSIFNFYLRRYEERLTEGLVVTVEPFLNNGSGQIYTADDGWTLKTADGSVAAQFEHTVIITGDGPILATAV